MTCPTCNSTFTGYLHAPGRAYGTAAYGYDLMRCHTCKATWGVPTDRPDPEQRQRSATAAPRSIGP